MLLQEFNLEIKDGKGIENQVANHLSRLESSMQHDNCEIQEHFINKHLLAITEIPWYVNYANYLVSGIILDDLNKHQIKKFFHVMKFYRWDEPFLFKLGPDNILRRCNAKQEQKVILKACHKSPYEGHFPKRNTTTKNYAEWLLLAIFVSRCALACSRV